MPQSEVAAAHSRLPASLRSKDRDDQAGRTVELRYRPEDLFAIEVWHDGRQVGWATPRRIARHVHRQAPPPPDPVPVPATGIDYLGQVLADHEAITTGPIAYRAVPGAPADGEPF